MTHPREVARRSALTIALASPLLAAACAPSPPASNDSSGGSSNNTITVGMEAGSPHEAFYKELAAEFTQQTGVRVEILGVPHDGMHQQFLSDAIAGGTAYDVLMVDQPWIAEFADNGYLEPLDDRLDHDARADFVQGTLDTVTYDGSIYALPFLVHNLVTYYRPSLLTAAGAEGPPTTWQEYRDAARLSTDSAGGTWGTMIPGNRDGEVATRFESYIQQAGGDIVDGSGHPDIDTPEALAALRFMTSIQFDDTSSPPGLHDLSAIQGQFLEGKVAMVSVWPYLWEMAMDPARSKISDDVAVALNPGNPDQVATTFSWSFGVSAGSDAKEAAWAWVSWATGSSVLARKGVQQLSPVPRTSAMEVVTSSEELTDRDRAALAVFSDSVARSSTMPMTPLYSSYQSAMAEAVSSVMSHQSSPDEALTNAQRQMEQTRAG